MVRSPSDLGILELLLLRTRLSEDETDARDFATDLRELAALTRRRPLRVAYETARAVLTRGT